MNSDSDTYSSDENELDKLQSKMELAKVKRGMFVSGWEDPADDSFDEVENPRETEEKELLWAANEGKNDLVEEILEKNPGIVNTKDEDGYTALHKACYNNNYELAEILLKYKADPNSHTNDKWTPMHSGCKWNSAKCVALLLQHGADVNALTMGDQTPLHIASTVSNCRSTLVSLLASPNIDAKLKNNSEEIAEQIALRTGPSYPLFQMSENALIVETGLI